MRQFPFCKSVEKISERARGLGVCLDLTTFFPSPSDTIRISATHAARSTCRSHCPMNFSTSGVGALFLIPRTCTTFLFLTSTV